MSSIAASYRVFSQPPIPLCLPARPSPPAPGHPSPPTPWFPFRTSLGGTCSTWSPQVGFAHFLMSTWGSVCLSIPRCLPFSHEWCPAPWGHRVLAPSPGDRRAVNTCVQAFAWTHVFNLAAPRRVAAGSRGRSSFSFVRIICFQ